MHMPSSPDHRALPELLAHVYQMRQPELIPRAASAYWISKIAAISRCDGGSDGVKPGRYRFGAFDCLRKLKFQGASQHARSYGAVLPA